MPDSTDVRERMAALRREMEAQEITHYLVPSSDEHLNEYLPAWRQRRQWMSGFTGSAGDLLVAKKAAETWLFADGRYHIQAERELEGSGISLQKVGAPEARTLPAMVQDLARKHGSRMALGYDPMVVSVSVADLLRKKVSGTGARLVALEGNLVDAIWKDRPAPPATPLVACPLEWTGAATEEKTANVRKALADAGADALVVVKLDQIAWLLNMRSLDDIPYNPVFESFLFVDRDSIHLFLHSPQSRVLPPAAAAIEGLSLYDYDAFVPFLKDVANARVLVDPALTTDGVLALLRGRKSVEVIAADSPIEQQKAIKNGVELHCMQRANLMASVAKTRALVWLEDRIERGETVTERSFRDHLERLYADIHGFRGLSFNSICGAGEHGAIIHYAGADDTPLRAGDLFLIDSGIQMDGGTTDDTRTVAIGPPTDDQRRRYTAVLRGHIRAAMQTFPSGTSGAAIDAITRSALWSEQINYDHGTGHGVGAFLNVHEGPFGIADVSRRAYAARPLVPGMITSIEPGYYEPSFGGIRIENLYQVVDRTEGGNGRRWFGFEPLTWIPMDPRLIDRERLERSELEWLDRYQRECMERLRPYLTEAENERLARMLR